MAYLRHNFREIAADAVLLVAWVLLGTEVLRLLAVPRWVQYLVLFGGVIAYAQLTANWDRPPRRDG